MAPAAKLPPIPVYPAKVLAQYPPDAELPLQSGDIAAQVFPYGVVPRLLRRSESGSDLQKLLYGKPYLEESKCASLFLFQVSF